jgi:aromatic ring-opening dioxygenase catalytic subunit (LigB family)
MADTSMTQRLPTYFLSHGGGPWPYMKAQLGATYDQLEASLRDIPRQLGEPPKAVLMVSGHWETAQFAVMATPNPPMVYDYGGFPEHTYRVQYPAPGAPALATRVHGLLDAAGLPSTLDDRQGYDHGAFVPMAVMYPQADVPMLQLSIRRGYDPAAHLAAGRALAPLRDEGVLIVGSGLTYHDMRNMGPSGKQASATFDRWLDETLVHADPSERSERLLHWTQAPAARAAHPREDHLLPLMVAVGAAEGDAGARIYHEEDVFGGIEVSSFRFGSVAIA